MGRAQVNGYPDWLCRSPLSGSCHSFRCDSVRMYPTNLHNDKKGSYGA